MSATSEVVHVAGPPLRAGNVRRQRCAWCGALLQEYDLTRVAVAVTDHDEEPPEPGAWEMLALVGISGTNPVVSRLVDPELIDGEPQIPADSCMALSDEVTR